MNECDVFYLHAQYYMTQSNGKLTISIYMYKSMCAISRYTHTFYFISKEKKESKKNVEFPRKNVRFI